MAVNNSLMAQPQQKMKISTYLTQDAIKNHINSIVGGKAGQKFIASIVSAVSTNPALQECDNTSILSAALLGNALNLSPSPQLGHYYMVPFKDKKTGTKQAVFQLGYKGYLQLAIRSGQYRKINVMSIKEGELEYFDPINEEIKVHLQVDSWEAREQAETIGYYAMFELDKGFRKALYWSKEQMMCHADKYSSAFSAKAYKDLQDGKIADSELWKYSSFWYKNFDEMAYKTMLRQLLSKWGIMSIDLQSAFESDMTFEDKKTGGRTFVEADTAEEIIEAPANVTEQPQASAQDVQSALFS